MIHPHLEILIVSLTKARKDYFDDLQLIGSDNRFSSIYESLPYRWTNRSVFDGLLLQPLSERAQREEIS